MGMPEPADHSHVLHRVPGRLDLLEGELELVQEERREDEVLGPDVLLTLGEEVAQLEVLRDVQLLVLRGHLDHSTRRRVLRAAAFRWTSRRIRRPLPYVVVPDPPGAVPGERDHCDDVEIGNAPGFPARPDEHPPHPARLRSGRHASSLSRLEGDLHTVLDLRG